MTAVLTDETAHWDGPDEAYGDHVPPGSWQTRYLRSPEVAAMEAALRKDGFVDGDPIKDISDGPMPYLTYLYRPRRAMETHPTQGYAYEVGPPQHQYLSIITYDGELVEVLLFVYEAAFSSRAKVRQQPLCARTIRGGLAEVLEAVNTVYSSPSNHP